jgi:Flp pilus assembly protein TadB
LQETRRNINTSLKTGSSLLQSPINALNKKLEQAGINKHWQKYLLSSFYIITPVSLAFLTNQKFGLSISLAIAAACVYLNNLYLLRRIKKRRQLFDGTLYVIYRFINMQLEAGLILGDIISCLPEAVQNKQVKEVLGRTAAAWKLTGDLDIAIGEMENSFGQGEIQILGNNLRQCLNTGVAGKSFAQMENLLFARFLENIRCKSRQLRNLLLAGVIAVSIPVLIVVIWPLVQEMLEAVSKVFIDV